MTKYNKIVKLANLFYKRAYDEKEAQFNYFFKSFMKRIANLASGCIASSQHLLSYEQYKNSTGLHNIAIQMPKIMNIALSADPNYPSQAYNSINGMIGGLTFHTNIGGAGTGLDKATVSSEDGITPPSYYVNTINLLLSKMGPKIKEREIEKITVNDVS